MIDSCLDKHLGGMTYGGYSKIIVVDEAFVLTVPKNQEPTKPASACVRT